MTSGVTTSGTATGVSAATISWARSAWASACSTTCARCWDCMRREASEGAADTSRWV